MPAPQEDVAVVITPDGVRRPVAVAIMTLILALAGRLMVKDRLTRQGPDGWAQRGAHMGEGLVGKTLGSLGMGNIGTEMFRMARPFDMQFAACDPFADEEVARSLGVEIVTAEELFRRSDFLCVNCPLTDETRHFVNAARLGLMKPSAYLINTARGPIVDQAALTKALKDGTIAGAGLDVFAEEPASADDPLFGLDNVIVTPHALCWTDECFAGIGAADIAAVFALLSNRTSVGHRESRSDKNRRLAGEAEGAVVDCLRRNIASPSRERGPCLCAGSLEECPASEGRSLSDQALARMDVSHGGRPEAPQHGNRQEKHGEETAQ